MATKYGLAIAAPFVKGTAGSTMETLRRNHNKDNLIQVASSLGWLVRDTLGIDVFKACLNLVESSPGCGGGMERLAKAYKLNRLGPYREGALNAAKITSEEFIAHMAKYGLNSYGEPLEDEEEAAAAAAALAASSQQQQLITQQQQRQQQGDSELFSRDLPVMSLFDSGETSMVGGSGGGGADGDDDGGRVSAPIANDDPARVDGVDDPHHVNDTGNVRAPAATDPLLAGGTVGRHGGADQSQAQAGSQVQGLAPADKKKLCKTVWRDDVCTDWTCDRAHPPRCGDPMCYPKRRKGCQYWHRGAGKLQQQQMLSQQSSQQPSQQLQRQQQRQHRRQQQQRQQTRQGNGHGAGPGRAGWRQAQGRKSSSAPQVWQHQQQGGQRHHLGLHRQPQPRVPLPAAPPPPPPPPHLFQHPGWQQQQQLASYRDVAARGTSHVPPGREPLNGAGFVPAQPDQALLNAVVAAVMAVLSRSGQQHS